MGRANTPALFAFPRSADVPYIAAMKWFNLAGISRKIKALYAPQVQRWQHDNIRKSIRDGVNGNYLRNYIVNLSNSPTGRRAVEVRANFIKGQGLMGEVPEWVRALHELITDDMAPLERFAAIIEMKAGGGIASIRHVPAEQVQWGIPDDDHRIKYAVVDPFSMNEGWIREPSRYERYPLWPEDPAQWAEGIAYATNQLDGYRGHIYFYNRTSFANRLYSRPILSVANDWLETDYRMAEFHASNSRNGLFPGGALNVTGDKDEVIDGETAELRLSKQLSEIATGSENAGNVMIFWRRAGETGAEFVPFQPNSNHEMFLAVGEEVRKNIGPIGTGVPLILMGLPTAGKLGDTQEIRNAFQLYNQATLSERQVLTQFYAQVLPLAGVKLESYDILPLLPPTDLPESIIKLMDNESLAEYLRRAYGVEIKVEQIATPAPAAEPVPDDPQQDDTQYDPQE